MDLSGPHRIESGKRLISMIMGGILNNVEGKLKLKPIKLASERLEIKEILSNMIQN